MMTCCLAIQKNTSLRLHEQDTGQLGTVPQDSWDDVMQHINICVSYHLDIQSVHIKCAMSRGTDPALCIRTRIDPDLCLTPSKPFHNMQLAVTHLILDRATQMSQCISSRLLLLRY